MNDVANTPVMYSSKEVERTLQENFLTEDLHNARKKERELLEQNLFELHLFLKTPLRVFDIGIGDGSVPLHFSEKLLTGIENYIGIDNSPNEITSCEKNIRENNLTHKIKTFTFNATHLTNPSFRQKIPLFFHAVVCTFFTPGNFKPNEINLKEDVFGHITPYSIQTLNPNTVFQNVFSEAYNLLCKNGKLILGSIYIDSPSTRLKQEAFYKKCGMHIITTEKDQFTATREGFWSERFTKEKIYSYLDWIDPKEIEFIPLDTENFAQMVVITKR